MLLLIELRCVRDARLWAEIEAECDEETRQELARLWRLRDEQVAAAELESARRTQAETTRAFIESQHTRGGST